MVLNPWPDEPSAMEESNRETIAQLGEVPVRTLPRLDLADPGSWPASEGQARSHGLPDRSRSRVIFGR